MFSVEGRGKVGLVLGDFAKESGKSDTTFNEYRRIRHFFPNSCAV